MIDKLLNDKLKYQPVKVMASSSFLGALSKQAESEKEEQDKKYNELLDSAFISLGRFSESSGKDHSSFKTTAEKLFAAVKIKPRTEKPYFYLSWLFLFVDEPELAEDYFNVANELNPTLLGMKSLKKEIELLYRAKNKLVEEKIPAPTSTFKPQPLGVNTASSNTNKTTTEEGFKPPPIQSNIKKTSNAYSQYKF